MSGLDALANVAGAIEDGSSADAFDEDSEVDEVVPLNSHRRTTPVNQDTMASSQDTSEPGTIVNWNKPHPPSLAGPVDAPNRKDNNRASAWKRAFEAADAAREANLTTTEGLYALLKDKCAIGKKQEAELKKAIRKSSKVKTLKEENAKLSADLKADRRVHAAEKAQYKTELEALKKTVKTTDESSKKQERDLASKVKSLQAELAKAVKELESSRDKVTELTTTNGILDYKVKACEKDNKSLEDKLRKYETAEMKLIQQGARDIQKEEANARKSQQRKDNHDKQLARAASLAGYHRSSMDMPKLKARQYNSSDSCKSDSSSEYRRRRRHSKKRGRRSNKRHSKKKHRRKRYYSEEDSEITSSSPSPKKNRSGRVSQDNRKSTSKPRGGHDLPDCSESGSDIVSDQNSVIDKQSQGYIPSQHHNTYLREKSRHLRSENDHHGEKMLRAFDCCSLPRVRQQYHIV